MREGEGLRALREGAPDVLAVVAYGEILPLAVLELGRLGSVNLHFSLLPRWRGASPVQHAIREGDELTGVTIMLMDEGLDTGPVLQRAEEAIGPQDDAGSLGARLATKGGALLAGTIRGLASGAVVPIVQPSHGITYAPKLTSADRVIAWADPAPAIDRQVRALSPSPGAATTFRDGGLKVFRGEPLPGTGEPGVVLPSDPSDPGVPVGTGDGLYRILEVAPAGRRRMAASEWARGARFMAGERLGVSLELRQSARTVALEAIRRVVDEDAYSTIVVPSALRRSRLDARDRAFATELAFGTIRRLHSIDWALGPRVDTTGGPHEPGSPQRAPAGRLPGAVHRHGGPRCGRRDGRAIEGPGARLRQRGPAEAGHRPSRVAFGRHVRGRRGPYRVVGVGGGRASATAPRRRGGDRGPCVRGARAALPAHQHRPRLRRRLGRRPAGGRARFLRPPRSTPRACSSTAATRRRSPAMRTDGSRSRIRPPRSSCALWTRGPESGCSTRAPPPEGRRATSRCW